MKRNFILAFATLLAVVLFQTTSLKLQSHIAQPLEGGLSNDPGQTTCVHCHSDITNGIVRNSQFIIKLSPDSAGLTGNANIVTGTSQYTPGCTQWISIELLGANTNGASGGLTPDYGFQFTALKASPNDSMAGTFTKVDFKTSMESSVSSYQPVDYGPVSYMGHKNADTTHVWYFKWTAPDSGSGPVTFYYVGNLGNGDASYNGDSIFIGSVTLSAGTPCISTGISNVSGNIHSVSVYPVPFSQQLNTDMYLNTSGSVSISLLSVEGQTIKELYNNAAAPQGHFSKSFNIGDIAAGIYFVRIQSGTDSKVIKVLKN
jgi:hypothetical protein